MRVAGAGDVTTGDDEDDDGGGGVNIFLGQFEANLCC